MQEAEEAEAQLGAEGVGILTNTAAATAITAARKRRRRSSIHDKPQMERPDFNLIERPSFQEEFEKRRRRTSPSPGAHLEVADEVKSPGVAKSPSELSVLDDKDHATPTNVLEEQEARAAADENTQPDVGEGPFSPTRSTRSSRGNQRTAVPGPSNRSARNRNSSPSIKDVKEEEKEDQAVQRGEEEEEEAPSESASTLSALSDGEGGVIGHLEEDLVEGDAEEAQGEGDDTIDAGTDENIEDDTETGTSVGPEDTPYKSPKGDSHSFPARDSTNSSLTSVCPNQLSGNTTKCALCQEHPQLSRKRNPRALPRLAMWASRLAATHKVTRPSTELGPARPGPLVLTKMAARMPPLLASDCRALRLPASRRGWRIVRRAV